MIDQPRIRPPATGIAPTQVPSIRREPLPKLPGAFNINLADPVGQAIENQRQSDAFINGLGQALFGEGTGSVFGGIPAIGPLVRGASAVPGVKLATDLIGTALGGGVGAVVGAAERIPLGWVPGGSDAIFNSLPKTPDWQAVNDASNNDLLAGGNQKFDYVKKFLEDQQGNIRDPQGLATLSPGLLAGPGGSLGGLAGQLLGVYQLPQRYVERGLAGTAKALSGMNRVQETLARAANGETLSPVEQAVVSNVGEGTWTEARALDFMASHGAGLSRDALLQIVGSFATDPLVLASLGTGVLAKTAAAGEKLIEQGVRAGTFLERAGVAAYGVRSSDLARIFKVGRTIVDPLSAIGGKSPAGSATVDLLQADVGTKAFLAAHKYDLGASTFRLADDLGMDTDAMLIAAGGRGATYARTILADIKQAEIIVTQRADGLFTPGTEAEKMMRIAPKDVVQRIRELAFEHRAFLWSPERKADLANQLSTAFGGDPVEIGARLAKSGDDELGLLHDILYAGDEGAFRKAAQVGASEYVGDVPYERLNMMDQSTLTDLGAAGFLKRIGVGAELQDAMASLRAEFPTAASRATEEGKAAISAFDAKFPAITGEAAKNELRVLQDSFPAARRYGDNLQYAIEDLTRRLAAGLDGDLPHQVTDVEMAKMPQVVRDFFLARPHRTLAFRPPDGSLWNISRDPVTGLLVRDGAPWTEHVFEGVTYRPGFQLPSNLAGQVLPVRVAVKALDWLEAGPRLLSQRISGSVLRNSAQQRFIKSAVENGRGIIDEGMARRIFNDLAGHLDVVDKPTITSLPAMDIWRIAEQSLPFNSGFTKRDALRWVIDGFEGDISLVGLGQKVPNKLRSMVTKALGYETNAMYQFSQDLYNQLRFRGPLAIMFKKQEQIEPYALNAMEGISMSRIANEADRALDVTVRNLSATSLLRGADQTDLLEQSKYALRNDTIINDLADQRGRLTSLLNPELPVLKRIGQLRMMGARLGTAVRNGFEADGRLDDFVAFKTAYAEAVGHSVTDTEYAQHWLNGIQSSVLSLGSDSKHLDIAGLLDEARTWGPADVGEVKVLALDLAAAKLNTLKGNTIRNVNDLVTSMKPSKDIAAARQIFESDIRNALSTIAPKAYIDRFMRTIDFDWGGFWANAADKFKMTPVESQSMQSWVAAVAHTQNMKPTEFLSQVVSSGLKQTWTNEEIEKSVALGLNVLRSPKGSTPELLANQLAAVFVGHMQPSGRQAVFDAMTRDGLIDVPAATSGFAQRYEAALEASLARSAESYVAKYPSPTKDIQIINPDTGEIAAVVRGSLGPGFHAQLPDVQSELTAELDRLQSIIPEVKVSHFDIKPLHTLDPGVDPVSAAGETFRTSDGGSAIYLDDSSFGPDARAAWDFNEQQDIAMGANRDFTDWEFGGRIQRRSNPGTPYSADGSMLGTVRHEYGHAVYEFIAKKAKRFRELREFIDLFEGSPAARQMSEAAMLGPKESAAELISVALNPKADLSRFKSVAQPTDLDALPPLSDTEYWKDVPFHLRPEYAGVPGAPQTTEEAVMEARRLLLDSSLMKDVSVPDFDLTQLDAPFANAVVRRATNGVPHTDPVMENAFRYFADWADASLSGQTLGHGEGELAKLLNGLARDGKAYDHTQGALLDAVFARIRGMEDETYRLQYFARDRTLLERSLNHPLFALYPASYMWFKIMPQMVKFIARSPFGVKTGAITYALADIQKDVAIQREFDPEFAEMIDGVGNNAFLWFLSYLLPATPWDIPAAWPAWARDLAGQGLANERRAQRGKPAKGIALGSIVTRVGASIQPLRSIEQGLRAGGALGDIVSGTTKEQARRPGEVGLSAAVAGPAQELAEPLGDAMQQLRDVLGVR